MAGKERTTDDVLPAPATRPAALKPTCLVSTSPRTMALDGREGIYHENAEGWVVSPKNALGGWRNSMRERKGQPQGVAHGNNHTIKEELQGADVSQLLCPFGLTSTFPMGPSPRSPPPPVLVGRSSASSAEIDVGPLTKSNSSDALSAASSEGSSDSVWLTRSSDVGEANMDLFTCPSPHRSPGIPLGNRQVKNVVYRVVASSAKSTRQGSDADANAGDEQSAALDERDYMSMLLMQPGPDSPTLLLRPSPPVLLFNPPEGTDAPRPKEFQLDPPAAPPDTPHVGADPARAIPLLAVQFALVALGGACILALMGVTGGTDLMFTASASVYAAVLLLSAGGTYALLASLQRTEDGRHSSPSAGDVSVNGVSTTTHLNPFVPSDFLSRFLNIRLQRLEVHSGMRHVLPVSVMFTSIKDFSNFISKVSQLNAYQWLLRLNDVMMPIIKQNGGVLETYLGDGMTVLNECPAMALSTALDMQVAMDEFMGGGCGQRVPDGCDMGIRIGLHHGTVCAGLIGDSKALSNTIISNVVNLASRFERLTKYYGARILLSAGMARDIPVMQSVAHRSLGRIRVKGSSEAYELLDVYHTDPSEAIDIKERTKNDFAAANLLFAAKQFPGAARKLRGTLPLQAAQDVGTSNELLARTSAYRAIFTKLYFCKKYHTEGVPISNWHGEDVWDQK